MPPPRLPLLPTPHLAFLQVRAAPAQRKGHRGGCSGPGRAGQKCNSGIRFCMCPQYRCGCCCISTTKRWPVPLPALPIHCHPPSVLSSLSSRAHPRGGAKHFVSLLRRCLLRACRLSPSSLQMCFTGPSSLSPHQEDPWTCTSRRTYQEVYTQGQEDCSEPGSTSQGPPNPPPRQATDVPFRGAQDSR